MLIELTPEQASILERATKSGMSPEEVHNQAFAVIEDQLESEDRVRGNREAISAHIEEGFQQAQRGELIDGEAVVRMLRERQAKREVA